LRLAFLNACESGTFGGGMRNGRNLRSEFTQGIAPSLVTHGLPAVVANQYKVLDATATDFARRFYWSLAHGLSVGEAAREARIAIGYSMPADSIDWAVPVLYAASPSVRFCRAPETTERASIPASKVETRSVRSVRRIQVGVWDIRGSFRNLPRTLDTLTNAQGVFEFKRVSVTAPIGTWKHTFQEHSGGLTLYAKEAARKLEMKALALGCDYLLCITDERLYWKEGTEEWDEWAWWPDKEERRTVSERVLFLSLGGLDGELAQTEGERVLANGIAICLIGTIIGEQSHMTGSSDCPFYWNVKRSDPRRLRLEPECRKKLETELQQSGLPKTAAAALEAILGIYVQDK
jgi:hypothetical protein